MAQRQFPSICADGASADRLCAYDGTETPLDSESISTLARHDLIIMSSAKLGLKWAGAFPGLATHFVAGAVAKAQQWRRRLAAHNSRAIVLADISVGPEPITYLPMSSKFWRRASDGHIATTMTDTGIRGDVDFTHPACLALIQAQVAALMLTGVVDGVVLRSWSKDSPERLKLVQAVRRGVGRAGVIVLESGVNFPSLSGPYANGLLVVDDGKGRPVWPKFPGLCAWARDHTRKPQLTVFEAFASRDRTRLYEMRMATALALVFGEGFVTFGDLKGHDWYDFWAPDLGRPLGTPYRKDGAYLRDFDKGTAVFNPPTNSAVLLKFPTIRTSVAKSLSARQISVQSGDGDIALAKPPDH
ncbi:MAG: hypothetical protein ACYC96_05375 [Fimbriimonadaceae bacterium]